MKKILVIDDDESILDAISLILEDAGYTVATSLKGEQTYKEVERFQPDLILLDVLMSGNDGRTICRKLKTDKQTKGIPVLMISAHPSAINSIKSCGADDFLAKPFTSEELLTNILKFLSK
jgi:DNA-binding response OmpR family regulator